MHLEAFGIDSTSSVNWILEMLIEAKLAILSCVTSKFDGWPWKTTEHIFNASRSFVHHFIANCRFIGSYGPEALIGGNYRYFGACDLKTWRMNFKNHSNLSFGPEMPKLGQAWGKPPASDQVMVFGLTYSLLSTAKVLNDAVGYAWSQLVKCDDCLPHTFGDELTLSLVVILNQD